MGLIALTGCPSDSTLNAQTAGPPVNLVFVMQQTRVSLSPELISDQHIHHRTQGLNSGLFRTGGMSYHYAARITGPGLLRCRPQQQSTMPAV